MIIKVKVKPNSKKQEIKKQGNVYKIKLKNEAENNKANKELINFLSKHFNTSVKKIKIKNPKSKKKTIDIKK